MKDIFTTIVFLGITLGICFGAGIAVGYPFVALVEALFVLTTVMLMYEVGKRNGEMKGWNDAYSKNEKGMKEPWTFRDR